MIIRRLQLTNNMNLVIETHSKEETIALAKAIAPFLFANSVITLSGDLGAGKTTFVSGIAKGLGIEEVVTSPTFNILKCYFHKPLSLFHIDAYRLDGSNKEIGLDEFIEGDGIAIVEWPNYIEELLPKERLDIAIYNIGKDNRKLVFSSTIVEYKKVFEILGEISK